MKEYLRLLDIVKKTIEYKEQKYAGITALKIKSQKDFDLAVAFWSEGHSYCGQYPKTEINGKFEGEDWYFIEVETIDYGMGGRSTKYWLESLTTKKKKFAEFCEKYEGDISE